MANPVSIDASLVSAENRQRVIDYLTHLTGPTRRKLWDRDGDGNYVQPTPSRLKEIVEKMMWDDITEGAFKFEDAALEAGRTKATRIVE